MKTIRTFLALAAILFASASNFTASADTYYVSRSAGNNRNDGLSASAPVKNLQKALDIAPAGSTILVAEGNYFGTLNSGTIDIRKPVRILGGYSEDFSERDILRHLTTVRPTPESNGSAQGKGTVQITSIVAPGEELLIDGIIFDRGNTISYNARREGQPEGVETPMMNPIGVEGIGGEELADKVFTKESYMIYFNGDRGIVNNLNVIVRNCAFINAPNYALVGLLKGSVTVENCVFANIRMATMDVRGADPNTMTDIVFRGNTVLFVWSRLKDLASMGYGFRYQPGTNCRVENNIFGCATFSALDRTHIDSNKNREALRHDTAEGNIFFLNRQTDLTLPGGGMLLRVKADDFDDVEQLAEVSGNRSLKDPSVFKGRIDEAYLNGFLNVSYKESTSYNPNSAANTFRSAMGMNMTGTMNSSVTMFANRYPWRKALDLFGAVSGCGAQIP